LLLAGLPTSAMGQDASPAELRREIEALRAQVEVAQAEREAAHAELMSLQMEAANLREKLAMTEAMVASLRDQLEAARQPVAERPAAPASDESTPSQPAEPRAEVPLSPLGSPESMRLALEKSFAEAFPNPNLSSEQAKAAYQRRLGLWTTEVTRSMRGQTRWRVLLSDVSGTPAGDRSVAARMQVVATDTGLPIGPAQIISVPARFATRLSTSTLAPEAWELTLMVAPAMRINERRLAPGPFNHPEFIGPMVEFGYSMEWIGMRKVGEEQADAPTQGDQP
jgi:hypothetical protein